MHVYLVDITAEIPYPWSRHYRQEATTEATAVARALKEYRDDVRRNRGRSKRIGAFTIQVRRGWEVKRVEVDAEGGE